MSQRLLARAPAKINLTLHVLGRRLDGYHELESLVAFAGVGDGLELAPDEPLGLGVAGPTAGPSGPVEGNLVLKAARHLADRLPGARLGRFWLTKRLPVAAGVGGGSSDAATALRLLARLNRLSIRDSRVREAAQATGADVPVCLEPRARMMRGAGERLGPALAIPRLFAVLINPDVPVETAPIFRALGLGPGERIEASDHPAIDTGASRDELLARIGPARNDLEAAAIALAPPIADALDLLRAAPGCRLARMSGSGATVFGIFDDCGTAAAASKQIRKAATGWWVKATSLR